jgi:LacI family transcriptional regulator
MHSGAIYFFHLEKCVFMSSPRATLKDIAEKSGYALRTVKKVMSGKEHVGEKTRKAILLVAEELKYQCNMLASVLSKNKVCRIAVIYSETSKSYFPDVEKGFLQCGDEYRDFGMVVELFKTYDRVAGKQVDILKELISGNKFDGIIIQPISRSELNPYIDRLADMGKPVITFGADATTEKKLCYIGPNAYKSGRIGAQILANYIGKKGNVAIISDNVEHMQTQDRIKGFSERIKEYYPDIRIKNIGTPNDETLYYKMVESLVLKNTIQGIFCTDANSYIAGEVLRDLKIKNIAVVGFDLSETASGLMKEGYIKVLIEQNPFLFSYNALKTMFNYIYLGEIPKKMQYTSLSILTSECLDE